MDEPASYEILVSNHLDQAWEKWFGGLEIVHSDSGETLLRIEMADQPALFGVLGKVRDLGLTLISVQRISVSPQDSGIRASAEIAEPSIKPNDSNNGRG